jgi:serine/threonine protein kinase
VVLCDLDAAKKISERLDHRRESEEKMGSSAYWPPEVARWWIARDEPKLAHELRAASTMDVWAIGVILFELCTGRTLFAQDISDNEIVDKAASKDMARLCVWNSIGDAELCEAFKQGGSSCPDKQRRAAKHLIRWCLQGDPAKRPKVKEVLGHPFLSLDPDRSDALGVETIENDICAHGMQMSSCQYFQQRFPELRGKTCGEEPLVSFIDQETLLEPVIPRRIARVGYHVFISHMQSEATGDVGTLYYLLEQLGLRSWRDMNADDLTEQGEPQNTNTQRYLHSSAHTARLSRDVARTGSPWGVFVLSGLL